MRVDVVTLDELVAAARDGWRGAPWCDPVAPRVVTVDLRLNTPRFVSLPNIIKARAKPLARASPADLGVDLTPRLKTLKVEEPPPRKAGIIVNSVGELVDRLRNDAKVL